MTVRDRIVQCSPYVAAGAGLAAVIAGAASYPRVAIGLAVLAGLAVAVDTFAGLIQAPAAATTIPSRAADDREAGTYGSGGPAMDIEGYSTEQTKTIG